MLRSPRVKFVTGPHKAAFETIVASQAFEEATLAALLEYQASLPLDCDLNQAVAAHNQMVGARRFLDTLCSIHKPETVHKQAEQTGLDETAGV
jgi:hypothetical protein